MSKVRFCCFADLHHYPKWFKTDAFERLTAIQQRAAEANCEFLVQLGDFTHRASSCADLIAQYENFSVPGFHVIGNHDNDLDDEETVLECFHLKCGYHYFDVAGFRFIALDTNYFSDFPGVYYHYAMRNYFDHGSSRDWMPPEQLAWLRETVLSSPYPVILMNHSSLEPGYGAMHNLGQVQEIIAASQNSKNRVFLCLNGHYHRNNLNVIDNVAYFDVNSASFNWINKPHHLFPDEWYNEFEAVGNQVIYEDPLSAIITLDSTRSIKIEGVKSQFVCGVTCEMSGNPAGCRPCVPEILSLRLNTFGL